MKEKKIYSNKGLFIGYGIVNLLLVLILLTLIILLINDIQVLSRVGFIFFVGIHISLLFFIKIQYLRISYDDDEQKVEFHYNKRYGLKWEQKARTVLLPMKQFDGYKITTDSLGIIIISIFKLEKKEQYELGPFYVGYISKAEKQRIEDAFGKPL